MTARTNKGSLRAPRPLDTLEAIGKRIAAAKERSESMDWDRPGSALFDCCVFEEREALERQASHYRAETPEGAMVQLSAAETAAGALLDFMKDVSDNPDGDLKNRALRELTRDAYVVVRALHSVALWLEQAHDLDRTKIAGPCFEEATSPFRRGSTYYE